MNSVGVNNLFIKIVGKKFYGVKYSSYIYFMKIHLLNPTFYLEVKKISDQTDIVDSIKSKEESVELWIIPTSVEKIEGLKKDLNMYSINQRVEGLYTVIEVFLK